MVIKNGTKYVNKLTLTGVRYVTVMVVLALARQIAVIAPLFFGSGFLPDRETLTPLVNIPSAIKTYIALPEEIILNSYAIANVQLSAGSFEQALSSIENAFDASRAGKRRSC